MKMQSLYFSKSGTGPAQKVADRISRECKCKCDQIPPAYPCEREMLVVLNIESGKPARQLVDFCKSFNPQRARNVAFTVSGSNTDGVEELKKYVKDTGVNVMDNVYECKTKGGLFGGGKVSDEQLAGVSQWLKDLFAEIEAKE